MTDVTLLIRIEPTPTVEDGKNGSRWKAGEIANVRLTSDITAETCYAPNCGFVHVTGVPGTIEKIQSITLGGHNGGDGRTQHRCKWRIQPKDLPNVVKTTLLRDRQITGTWEQLKPHLKNQVIGDTPIEDGDLN